jgi:tetratricopeptide (TPR) repeat protein
LIPQADATLPPPAPAVNEKPALNEKSGDEGDLDFATRGQDLFLAGKYPEAVKAFRHAVLDDPRNGPLLALTGEALWAAGNYHEAAGALQRALLATPEADWTGVANRAARLTPVDAVNNLAKALGKDELPELRFLAGWQSFGAGKYQEAAAHLDLLLKKAPDDQVAKKLRDQAVKLGEGK